MKSVFFHSFDDLRQNRINKSATRRQEAPVKLRSVEFEMGAPLLGSLYFCHFYIHNFHSYCYIFIFDLMHHLRKSCTDPLYSCDDSQTCCPVDFVSMLLQIAPNSFWLKAWNQHLLNDGIIDDHYQLLIMLTTCSVGRGWIWMLSTWRRCSLLSRQGGKSRRKRNPKNSCKQLWKKTLAQDAVCCLDKVKTGIEY